MSLPLLHSPCDIVRRLIIAKGAGADPDTVDVDGNPTGAWPVYATGEPSRPDAVLTVYDTTPVNDGRSMPDGYRFQHYGIQVRVRGTDAKTAFAKANAIRVLLDEGCYDDTVTLDGTDYQVLNFAETNLLSLGKDTPATKRSLFTVNATVTIDVPVPVPPFDASNSVATQVLSQPDGKTVVAGYQAIASSNKWLLIRYNAVGHLDTTFGTNGVVITDWGTLDDRAFAAVLDASGNILVAGTTFLGNAKYVFAVARYTPAGQLDATFGSGGKVTIDIAPAFASTVSSQPTSAYVLAVQADGKILVGGAARIRNTGDPTYQQHSYALARLTTVGVLDSGFGTGGIVTTNPGPLWNSAFAVDASRIHNLLVRSDGKIVASGVTIIGGTEVDGYSVVRYNADGTLDTSFGATGSTNNTLATWSAPATGAFLVLPPYAVTPTRDNRESWSWGAALQAGDKIVISGTSSYNSFVFAPKEWLLARLTAGGVMDSGFGSTPYYSTGTNFTVSSGIQSGNNITPLSFKTAMAVQSSGKFVMAGQAAVTGGFVQVLGRYNTDGTLDTTFGTNGFTTIDFSDPSQAIHSLAVDSTDRVIAAGYAGIAATVARFTADGILDTVFAFN